MQMTTGIRAGQPALTNLARICLWLSHHRRNVDEQASVTVAVTAKLAAERVNAATAGTNSLIAFPLK